MIDPPRQLSEGAGDYVTAFGKAAPPIAVSGVTAAGMSLQDWVLVATLVYTIAQTAHLIYRFVRDHRNAKRERLDG
ncbi:hypothetical protein [uncultured Croceicoccus sp.]|uniref:hypothetical protein n=1 Tax=uncultured Croceicoccus sp. TaxID=1295329 RepID=UPI00263418E0|nr:hypothetical protein [uncultured Croceicoccus sp.]